MNFDSIELVRDFHARIGAAIADKPRLLRCDPEVAHRLSVAISELSHDAAKAGDLFSQRLAMTLEELAEWAAAHAAGDLVAAADAWADRMYVLLGDAVAAGLPAWELLQAVQTSNITKAAGRATDAGKGVKSGAYQPPKLAEILMQASR